VTPQVPVEIGVPEVLLVLLATLIIFAILGPRLWRDVRARRRGTGA
jgi:hypothetical protein